MSGCPTVYAASQRDDAGARLPGDRVRVQGAIQDNRSRDRCGKWEPHPRLTSLTARNAPAGAWPCARRVPHVAGRRMTGSVGQVSGRRRPRRKRCRRSHCVAECLNTTTPMGDREGGTPRPRSGGTPKPALSGAPAGRRGPWLLGSRKAWRRCAWLCHPGLVAGFPEAWSYSATVAGCCCALLGSHGRRLFQVARTPVRRRRRIKSWLAPHRKRR